MHKHKCPIDIVQDSIVLEMEFMEQPKSKARVRFTREGRTYADPMTKAYEDRLAWQMKSKMTGLHRDKNSRFGLYCIFYRKGKQRIDCDNMLKAVSDAATQIVWHDDNQVHEIYGRMFLGRETPRTEIIIYKVRDETPKTFCGFCNKEWQLSLED